MMTSRVFLIKALTLLCVVSALAYVSLTSTFTNVFLVFLGFIILLEILYYFPSKLNYPGKVNERNKEILYSTAKQLLLQTAFLLSLMTLVLAFQVWTNLLLGVLVVVLLAVVTKEAIIISRNVE